MRQRRTIALLAGLLLAAALTACAPAPNGAGAPEATPLAEASPSASPSETASALPQLRFVLPTAGGEPISAWRPPLYPVPWALSPEDHFYFARPIGADQINWPLASYRYGGVFFSEDVVHTGVDIPADKGTPVLAAGPGRIVWAGWGFFTGLPDNIEDPYGITAVIKHDFGYEGQTLYTVYAHMDSIAVVEGQYVRTGEVLGQVGETGYTTGPHLHFEVRLGKNTYYYTRNPELWIAPPQGWGVLAGRIMKPNGELYHQLQYYVIDKTTRQQWDARTYGPEAVRSDDYYRENTVIGDLPAGLYLVRIPLSERVVELTVEVFPGRVTYFTYREDRGFTSGAPATPVFTPPPPRPSATP